MSALCFNSLSSSLAHLSRTAVSRKCNPRATELFITSRNVSKNTCMYAGARVIWWWREIKKFPSRTFFFPFRRRKNAIHPLSASHTMVYFLYSIFPSFIAKGKERKSPFWSSILAFVFVDFDGTSDVWRMATSPFSFRLVLKKIWKTVFTSSLFSRG